MVSTIAGIAVFLLMIGLLIGIHEYGHYSVARIFKIGVNRFSIGFGKPLLRWHSAKSGTEWVISAIPLGGYVALKGFSKDEGVDDKIEGRPYHELNRFGRMAIIFAGPAINILAAFALYTASFYFTPTNITPPVAGSIVPGSPAEKAGMKPGDRVISVDGSQFDYMSDFARYVQIHLDKPMEFSVLRSSGDVAGNEIIRTTIVPEVKNVRGSGGREIQIGIIGMVSVETKIGQLPLSASIDRAFGKTLRGAKDTFTILGQIITTKRDVDNISGVVGMAHTTTEIVKADNYVFLITFTAMISMGLAMVNLLPIPGLDGGHLTILTIETFIRRDLPQRVKLIIAFIGMAIVLGFMALTMFIDASFIIPQLSQAADSLF